jgi:hypothetical protein
MKVALKNKSNVDVLNYPIEEAVVDINGNPIFDNDTQTYKTTGKTLEWTIKAGEKAVFPKYVADYLQKIYGFLASINVSEKYLQEDTILAAPEVLEEAVELPEGEVEDLDRTSNLKCRYCDFVAKGTPALGMHVGARHPEKI